MQTRNRDRGETRAELVRIVGHHLVCSICGRSLLTGELAQIVDQPEGTRVTCDLCQLGVGAPTAAGRASS